MRPMKDTSCIPRASLVGERKFIKLTLFTEIRGLQLRAKKFKDKIYGKFKTHNTYFDVINEESTK